jgi:hypothetical protein
LQLNYVKQLQNTVWNNKDISSVERSICGKLSRKNGDIERLLPNQIAFLVSNKSLSESKLKSIINSFNKLNNKMYKDAKKYIGNDLEIKNSEQFHLEKIRLLKQNNKESNEIMKKAKLIDESGKQTPYLDKKEEINSLIKNVISTSKSAENISGSEASANDRSNLINKF